MSTTTRKWKFRFTRGFKLVLGLNVKPVIFSTFLNAHSPEILFTNTKLLTFAGLSNLVSH